MLTCLLALPGTVLAVPALGAPPPPPTVMSPSSPSLQFGPQDMHFQSTPMQESFINTSLLPTTVRPLTIIGPDASSFSIPSSQDSCSGQTIPGGGSCTVQVVFYALGQGPGPKDATLRLVDGTPETVDVPLSGNAVTGTLSLHQNSLDFGTQVINQGNSNQQSVTVAAGPNDGALVTQQQITGPDASSFSVQGGGCVNFTLGPGITCQIFIQFQPSSAGAKHAVLEIENDGTATPLLVSLTGTGLNGPALSISPPQAIYGNVTLGTQASQTFTLRDKGDAPLQIQGLALIAGSPQAFPISHDGCSGQQIAPGASCQLTVGFIPIALGGKDAALLMITNASKTGVTFIGLSGTGVPPLPALGGSAKVLGIAQAGQVLTCSTTSFPAGVRFSYQWLRAGRPITRATARRLALGNADVGAKLSCRVTATGPTGSQTVTSPSTARTIPELTIGKVAVHGFTITAHVTVSSGKLLATAIITSHHVLGQPATRTHCKADLTLRQRPARGRCAFGPQAVTNETAGTYTITLSPGVTAETALNSGQTIHVRETLTLTAAHGLSPTRKAFSVIIHGPKAHQRH